jgi:hypothetical protein
MSLFMLKSAHRDEAAYQRFVTLRSSLTRVLTAV